MIAAPDGRVKLLGEADFSVFFERETRTASIVVHNGYADRASFARLSEAVRELYRETSENGESIVIEFDVSAAGGVYPSSVYGAALLFRELRPVSDVILISSRVKMRRGAASAAVKAFLSLYPISKPIDVVEVGEDGAVTGVKRIAPGG